MKNIILTILAISIFACGSGSENLEFNISGARGLVLHQTPVDLSKTDNPFFLQPAFALDDATETTLAALLESGEVDDDGVVVAGSPTIDYFTVVNEKAYLILGDDASVKDETCRFVSVDVSTDAVACVDDTIDNVLWSNDLAKESGPVQISDAGDVYYMFHTPSDDGESDGTTTLRVLESDGTKTDLLAMTDTEIEPYFVLNADGSVLVAGNGDDGFLKKVGLDGTLTTLSESPATFVKKFPDGNIYFGVWGPNEFGVARYLSDDGELDSTKWISMYLEAGNEDGDTIVYDDARYYDCTDFATNNDFSDFCGAYVYDFVTTDDGMVFGRVQGRQSDAEDTGYLLFQYYPVVARPTTEIANVTALASSGDDLIVAGASSSGENKIVIFDTVSESETEILEGYDLTVGKITVGSDGSIALEAYNNDSDEYVVANFTATDIETVTFSDVAGDVINMELFE